MIQHATPINIEEKGDSQESAAPAQQLCQETLLIDPELQSLVDAWPNLSESTKADILALVRKSESA